MIDKNRMKDKGGRRLTQSLFLEYQYNTDYAVYTVDGQDKEYNGVVYPSLKRLYLEAEDVMEYNFVANHLYDWDHWTKMLNNKWCMQHIEQWRMELALKVQSTAIERILEASDNGNFQAAKFLADRGWDKKRGRPSKDEVEKVARQNERLNDEYSDDAARLGNIVNLHD